MPRPAHVLLLLSYLAFVSLGLPDTVLGVAWPSLRATFGVSQAGLGAVLGAGVCGYFASGLLAGRLAARMGVGGLLAGSTALVAAGLLGYVAAPAWAAFIPMATGIGLGSGAIDAALNGYAARHFPVRHLNWLHASWGLGATLGPVIMTQILARGSSFRAGYAVLAVALASMALAFAATRRRWDAPREAPRGGPAAGEGAAAAAGRDPGALGALRRGRVWLQVATFFLYTGLEASAGQWCFTFLREVRGLGVEAAGAWTSAYWGGLLCGRVALGFVVDRVGPDRLLRAVSGAAVLGALVFAASDGALGGAGLVLVGASLAPVFPTLMARTPARLGAAAAHAVGFQVSAATLGAAALPAALGLLIARAGPAVVPPALVGLALALLLLHEALLRAGEGA